jgi:hypothetical protein
MREKGRGHSFFIECLTPVVGFANVVKTLCYLISLRPLAFFVV